MKCTVEKLKELIAESIRKVLIENISDTVYHFCSIQSCAKILHENRFLLTLSSNMSDAYNNERLFYFSTTRSRSKTIGYGNHFGTCVRLQLDGRLLNERYKGKPIDYWGNDMGKQYYYRNGESGQGFNNDKRYHTRFEMEDRIFSFKPYIDNAEKYIERIDVLLKIKNGSPDISNEEKDLLGAIAQGLGGSKGKVFIYDNENDFNYQTDKTVTANYSEWKPFESRPMEYNDSKLKKMHDSRVDTIHFESILGELINIYTNGKLFLREPQTINAVKNLLSRFELSEFFPSVLKSGSYRYGHSPAESCTLLANTINAPVRKLNTESNDVRTANKIMELAAYILKINKEKSFTELRAKFA